MGACPEQQSRLTVKPLAGTLCGERSGAKVFTLNHVETAGSILGIPTVSTWFKVITVHYRPFPYLVCDC